MCTVLYPHCNISCIPSAKGKMPQILLKQLQQWLRHKTPAINFSPKIFVLAFQNQYNSNSGEHCIADYHCTNDETWHPQNLNTHTYTKTHLQHRPSQRGWQPTETVLNSLIQHNNPMSSFTHSRGRWNKRLILWREAEWGDGTNKAKNTKSERGNTNSVEGDKWEMRAANWLEVREKYRGQIQGEQETEDE